MNSTLKKYAFLSVFVILFAGALVPAAAEQMSASESAEARAKLIKYSKQFIGSRYAEGGIGPDTFDCSGFVFTCARESIGVQLPRMTKAMYSFVKLIPESQREAGDLVFFKTTSSDDVSHVGIYIGNNQFIHAASDGPNTGVIVSSLKEAYWKGKYFKSGQFLPPSNDSALADSSNGDSDNTMSDASNQSGDKSVTSNSAASGTSRSNSRTNSSANASGKRSSSNSDESSFSDFFNTSSFIADASFGIDWNFMTAHYFRLTFRGISGLVHVRYADSVLQPGAGVFLRWDSGTGTFQIPIVLSLSLSDYFRIYAGPVICIGTPYLPGESDTKIKSSFFPGMLGVLWQTPSFNAGKTQISFVQDIHYTVFNDTDGSALSGINSVVSGLVFSSGFRVTLPLSSLLK